MENDFTEKLEVHKAYLFEYLEHLQSRWKKRQRSTY